MGHPSQSGEEAQWGNVGPTQSSGCLKKGSFSYTLPETTLLRELTFSHLENGMVGIRVRFLLGQKAYFLWGENVRFREFRYLALASEKRWHLEREVSLSFNHQLKTGASCLVFMEGKLLYFTTHD